MFTVNYFVFVYNTYIICFFEVIIFIKTVKFHSTVMNMNVNIYYGNPRMIDVGIG